MKFIDDRRVFRTRLGLLTAVIATAALASGYTDAVAASSSGAPSTFSERASGTSTPAARNAKELSAFDVEAWARSEVAHINPTVLALALDAAQCATTNGAVDDPETLTIIDYSKASVEPRLWVLNLKSRELLYEELVSHGQGSGGNFATKFSNTPDSHQTSIGLFVTDTTYVGRNGYSLRLDGLDKGFNDRARERAIVMHGAPYVNEEITKSLGRLGRSHGCPAVRASVARELIDRVKEGDLVFAYYPNQDWLQSSKFLGDCGN